MGLTIHYALSARGSSLPQVRTLLRQLRTEALDLPFQAVGDLVELTGAEANFENHRPESGLRWLLIQASQAVEVDQRLDTVQPQQVVAFTTEPGAGSEPANFGLALYPAAMNVADSRSGPGRTRRLRTGLACWSWHSFCKTAYAADPECGGIENFLRSHISIVKLLDRAAQLGFLASVSDEGDFWDQRDCRALARQAGGPDALTAGWIGRLKSAFGEIAELQRVPIPAPR